MDHVALRPRRVVAPDTPDVELQRLAIQERSHDACDALNVQTIVWLQRAATATLNRQTDRLRHAALSPSAFNVLLALHNTSGHMLEPCQLADRLLVSRPSITGLLDTLQARGLIHRRPHGDDRRRVLVELTDAGMQMLRDHFGEHFAAQNDAVSDLDDDEKITLIELLRKVRGATPADLRQPAALVG
jgi:DNA-binding MarR family transcriptional regulator